MTTLLLIRHGETPWNALLKVQGCTDIDLSTTGISQAKLLSNRLKGNFNAIYSSPLSRAYDTASILCENTTLNPIKIDDLREVNFGSWEGLTFKEISAKYPVEFSNWKTDDVDGKLYDGDGSIKDVSTRAINCIYPLLKQHKNETIVIVSHGAFIKSALIGILGWNMSMYHHFALGNTCITELHFNDDMSPVLVTLNDTSHLISSVTAV